MEDIYVDNFTLGQTNAKQSIAVVDSLALLSIQDLDRVNKYCAMQIELGSDNGYILDQKEAIEDLPCTKGLADATLRWFRAASFVERVCWLNIPRLSVTRV